MVEPNARDGCAYPDTIRQQLQLVSAAGGVATG